MPLPPDLGMPPPPVLGLLPPTPPAAPPEGDWPPLPDPAAPEVPPLGAVSLAPVIATWSKMLPRIDGSRIIWLTLEEISPP